jgi:transposase-like protein
LGTTEEQEISMTRPVNPKAMLGDWGPWEEREMMELTRMARQKTMADTARAQMAKDYLAGGSPSEIARHYGVSPSYVINVARKWDNEQTIRRLKAMVKEARRQIVPPPMETPDPGSAYVPIMYRGHQIIRITKRVSKGNSADHYDSMISLPYYAIQGAR